MLHLAVGCSSKVVEKFLGLGAGIEAADKRGRTPLHYSAAKGASLEPLLSTSAQYQRCAWPVPYLKSMACLLLSALT